jgi:hypothetical protein
MRQRHLVGQYLTQVTSHFRHSCLAALISLKDHVRSVFSFLRALTMTYISHLSKKISTRYASKGTRHEQQEDSIEILYKKFKNEPSRLHRI